MKAKYLGKGEGYHGIPARDLSNEDFERLTPEQQALVESSPLYEIQAEAQDQVAETKAKVTKAKEE